MPTLSNGSELTVFEGGEPHVAYSFTLTDTGGSVSDPIGALPGHVFGYVTLESVDVFDGFFAITGFMHDGRHHTFSNLDTYLFDNDGNFIRTVHADGATHSLEVVSVTAESPDDLVVTYRGATYFFSGQNTQYGEHQIIVKNGVQLPGTFVNTEPVLADLNVVLAPGQSLVDIEFPATDADFDLLSFSIVDGPDHGTIELDTRFDGNHYPFPESDFLGSVHYHAAFLSGNLFDYRPQAGFVGTDTFTVMATDGQGNSNLSTVTVTVGASMAGPEYMALSHGADILRYQSSIRELRQGEQIVALVTDGLLDFGDRPYEDPAAFADAIGAYTDLADNIRAMMLNAHSSGATDSATVIAWRVTSEEQGLMPTS